MSEDIERITSEYMQHLNHVEVLQRIIGEYKKQLNALVEEQGEEDDKGHQWLPAGKYLLQRQRRQGKKTLNLAKAEEWARERGIWSEVSRTVEVLDEDALVGYIYDNRHEEGLEEAFQELHDTPPVSYAFIKPIEEENYEY